MIAAGVAAAVVVAGSATVIIGGTVFQFGYAPEYEVALVLTAAGALGWAGLGSAALRPSIGDGLWPIFLAVVFELAHVVPISVGFRITDGTSRPIGSYDAYMVAVAVLGLLSRAALCTGFALVLAMRTPRHVPTATRAGGVDADG